MKIVSRHDRREYLPDDYPERATAGPSERATAGPSDREKPTPPPVSYFQEAACPCGCGGNWICRRAEKAGYLILALPLIAIAGAGLIWILTKLLGGGA